MIMHLPNFPCCTHMQQENRIDRLGSFLPFTAVCVEVSYADKTDLARTPVNIWFRLVS